MNYTEEAAVFSCEGQALIGVLAKPEAPKEMGVVVIVGGPQYRAGSHRQFVKLSRALASEGFPVLRFDYRGMGDSEGPTQDFNSVTPDIGAAIDVLRQSLPSVRHVVLWGLCDGASAALLYCHNTQDTRVGGLCLLNPWVRSESSLARTQVKHYYTQRLIQREFWVKLLSGKVALGALNGLVRNVRTMTSRGQKGESLAFMPFQQRMAAAWAQFGGKILLVLSGDDYTAKEFLEYVQVDTSWCNALKHPGLVRSDMPGADHTFSNLEHGASVEKQTIAWLS